MTTYGAIRDFQRISRQYVDTIDNVQASYWLAEGYDEINGMIGVRYSIPLNATTPPPLIKVLNNRLAAYRAIDAHLSDSQPNASDANTRKLNEVMAVLASISQGKVQLVSAAGTIISPMTGGGTKPYGMALTRTHGADDTIENKPLDWMTP
jgi:phage gp36-like protein